MPEQPIWYPPSDGRSMKALRFANLLDDEKNILSPVKFNLWSANLVGLSAGVATVLHWLGGHIGMVGEMWAPLGGWIAQAHISHHYDKRERNKQELRLKETGK